MSLWDRTSPYQPLYDQLWFALVPRVGAAATPHGEWLRCMGRLYYERHAHGFGRGSMQREWQVLSSFADELAPHAAPDLQRLGNEIKKIGYGTQPVPRHWDGDAALERVAVATLTAVKRLHLLAGPPTHVGIDQIETALADADPDVRLQAVRLADKLVADQPGWLDDNAAVKLRRSLRSARDHLPDDALDPRTRYLLEATVDATLTTARTAAPGQRRDAIATAAQEQATRPTPQPAAQAWHWDESKKKALAEQQRQIEAQRRAVAREAAMAEELRQKVIATLSAKNKRLHKRLGRRFFPKPTPGGTFHADPFFGGADAGDQQYDNMSLEQLVELAVGDLQKA